MTYIADKRELVGYLKENARPQDLIITMGAGDIYQIGEQYVQEMEKK